MIPNDTRVRVKNVFNDIALKHVDGFEGVSVSSYLHLGGPKHCERRYLVNVNGLDYDLSADELEIV